MCNIYYRDTFVGNTSNLVLNEQMAAKGYSQQDCIVHGLSACQSQKEWKSQLESRKVK